MRLQPPALIVFDLDGTLIDSRRDLADAVNELVAEAGGAPLSVDLVAAMVGDGAAVLVRRALAAAGLDSELPGALDRFLEHYDARLTVHTRPYPGTDQVLQTLRAEGHPLAVLTNKPERHTVRILNRLGLSTFFGSIVGGDTAAGRKPDPAGLLQVVERMGGTSANTLVIGDSPVDLETARRGGTGICLVRYGFGYRFAADAFRGDELFVDEPGQLPGVCARWSRRAGIEAQE